VRSLHVLSGVLADSAANALLTAAAQVYAVGSAANVVSSGSGGTAAYTDMGALSGSSTYLRLRSG